MSYTVTILENNDSNDYLRVEVSGKRIAGKELEYAKEALEVIKNKCIESNLTKALAIMSLTGEMPFMSAYKLGEKADDYGWGRGLMIAAVYANGKSRQIMRFSETVTANRGFQVRVFANENEAVHWLRSSPEKVE